MGSADGLAELAASLVETESVNPGLAADGSGERAAAEVVAAWSRAAGLQVELDKLERRPRHQLLGTGSIHASLIEGGQEFSSYPERCVLTGERRTLPGESADGVEQEVRGLIEGMDATMRLTFAREPFETDPSHEFAQQVAHLAGGLGVNGVSFWTDAALLAAEGLPTVLYGPTGGGAHAIEEWVELTSLERCCSTYVQIAREVCAGRNIPVL